MKIYSFRQIKQIAEEIKAGKIVVLPTDTIYGICCNAFNKNSVEKVYQLRNRDKNKPCIILISQINDLRKFGIKTNAQLREFLGSVWPNKISVILPCQSEQFTYLHKGTQSLALRIPQNVFLLKLLKTSGPIIAPSANVENKKPSKNVKEAYGYFGDSVMYVDDGELKNSASTLVKIELNFDIKILRPGQVSGNNYFLMRHTEAFGNVKKIISSSYPEKWRNSLTEKGKKQVAKQISKFKHLKIDLIISSPFLRTKQTAKILSAKLAVPLIIDKRLREINCGIIDNKDVSYYDNFVKTHIERYRKKPKAGEALREVKIRMLSVIFELEKKYQNKNIIIISHGHPLWALYGAMRGYTEEATANHLNWNFKLGEIRKAKFLQ
jgi:tRNA threonylcarbamoyl adenosine modification protein (Sua5/YciO/YrdC/YwlC family)